MDAEVKLLIDQKMKAICDVLLDHINTLDSAHTAGGIKSYSDIYPTDTIDSPISNVTQNAKIEDVMYEHPASHAATMIDTDPSHRFITDFQVATFADKVDRAEMNRKIKEEMKDLRLYVNATLNNILNSKNVAQNLRSIATIVSEDANLNQLLNVLQQKADLDEFNTHDEDYTIHLTDHDRFLLKSFDKILTVGIADWNAEEDDPNYIANKPECMIACGGNADTVGGYGKQELLMNKRTHTIVLGTVASGASLDSVDYLCNGENDSEVLQKAISEISNLEFGGSIYLREGVYYLTESMTINPKTFLTICGCDDATVFDCGDTVAVDMQSNITIRDLKIKNSINNLHGSNITIKNVSFDKGTIYMDTMNKSRIIECNMKTIKLQYKTAGIYNNIISNNIFEKCDYSEYNGGNNLFINNIRI